MFAFLPVQVIKRTEVSALALKVLEIQGSVQLLSCVRLSATPWTAAHQASLCFLKT